GFHVGSCMRREVQVQFCERAGVRFPCATHLVVCARTETEARAALEQITAWVQQAGLKLHPTKTRIVNAAIKGGFDFLGYHFEQYGWQGGKKWPRQKSQFKLRES